MKATVVTRRNFIKGTGFALAALSGIQIRSSYAAPFSDDSQVPFNGGTQRPKLKAPANACDCHHHIYDSRFPVSPNATLRPPDATVADYRRLQKWIGTTRNVVVTPSTYGTDNSCLLDALSQFGPAARGIAVVDTSVTDAELKRLNDAGVRGIRIQIVRAGATTVDMIEPLSRRIIDLGWHLQFHLSADGIVEIEELLRRLPTQIVFDHLGRIPQPVGVGHPAFRVVCNLMDRGQAWVKLSGAYHDSKIGSPSYADTTKVAKAYVQAAPDRVVWGTDWPYPSASAGERAFPDVAALFDRLADYVPDEGTLQRILVDNPAALYGFSD
ncbi:MAG: amidohydrolase family protein [Negativicutes bacterium]|nr:amidohydrolase family protein [Negativicutes bacterium]